MLLSCSEETRRTGTGLLKKKSSCILYGNDENDAEMYCVTATPAVCEFREGEWYDGTCEENEFPIDCKDGTWGEYFCPNNREGACLYLNSTTDIDGCETLTLDECYKKHEDREWWEDSCINNGYAYYCNDDGIWVEDEFFCPSNS